MSTSSFSNTHSPSAIEPDFPHLNRLCSDFGLRVLCKTQGGIDGVCLAVDGGSEYAEKLTPVFTSKAELEAYAAQHVIDILHRYLGEEQPDSDYSESFRC